MKTINKVTRISCVVAAVYLESMTPAFSQTEASSSSFFAKESWGANYLNYMNGPTFTESTGGSINHYFTIKRKLGAEWALSGVFRPDTNFENGKSLFTLDDPYLKLDYPVIYKNLRGTKLSGDFRYYAPVGEDSRTAKIAGILSPRFSLAQDIGRWKLLYILIPKFYLNTEIQDGQKLGSHAYWISTSYHLSHSINLDFALYPGWSFKRNQEVSFNNLPAYPGFTLNFTESFALSPYVEIPLMKLESKTVSVGGNLSYTLM